LQFINKRLKAGDLLTARTGYPGTTRIIPEYYENSQSYTTLITRLKKNTVDTKYISHYINSANGQKFFEQNQIGGGQKNVNAGSLKNMPIILPPLPEQSAIASLNGCRVF
jgi:type I restriction enzyme S subunit